MDRHTAYDRIFEKTQMAFRRLHECEVRRQNAYLEWKEQDSFQHFQAFCSLNTEYSQLLREYMEASEELANYKID